ncbi:Cytidylate kinase-like family protein [Sulfidibacter corallicola]|uniref:Cytidylate kinase-like family protein n=1 Tax=Sulfidibacter corallicola TaxID=2818388 RepID=A0A8A4TN44_SULCO|nr:cytidylate kinase-like family protein [Sulfidibacter corallicola]QTD50311.1 cytidylate kinase-like family protein [Sulfidibacter corallicola]
MTWLNKDADLQIAAQFKLQFTKKSNFVPWFITISREYGCDGAGLAQGLVGGLNEGEKEHPWYVFDRETMLKVADPEELNQEMLELLEEYGHSEFQGYVQEAIFGKKSQYKVIQNMAKLMQILARRGHVIFLGGGSTVLTQNNPHGIHFRLYAPEDWRATNHGQRHKLDFDTAHSRVQERENQRFKYLKTYLAESIDNRYLYDLIINNAKVGTQQAIELALATVKRKFKQKK